MIFRTMFGNFSFPQTKVCLLSATQIPHKICTALSKKMSGLQELLKTWKECISLPISSQPNTTPSLHNLKTQHVKHTSDVSATLHTFPHCNLHMRKLKTQHAHISTTQNILHVTHLLLHNYKVIRCLARISPSTTTTNQPTNRAPNELASLTQHEQKMLIFGPK